MTEQCVIELGGRSASPTGDAPFLEMQIAEARRRGFRRFLLLTGRQFDWAAAFLRERDIAARHACEVSLESARLVAALPRLDDAFLLLNGEVWFDFNWRDLAVRGARDGAEAAMSLRRVSHLNRHWAVTLDGARVSDIRLGEETHGESPD